MGQRERVEGRARAKAVAERLAADITAAGGPQRLKVWQKPGVGTRIYWPGQIGYLSVGHDGSVVTVERGRQVFAENALYPAWRAALKAGLAAHRARMRDSDQENPQQNPFDAASMRQWADEHSAQYDGTDIRLYHGTDGVSARRLAQHGIDLRKSKGGYFGFGFYVTPDRELAFSNYAYDDFTGGEDVPGAVVEYVLVDGSRVLDLRKDADSDRWGEANLDIADRSMPARAVKQGIDGVYDRCNDAITVYNPDILRFVQVHTIQENPMRKPRVVLKKIDDEWQVVYYDANGRRNEAKTYYALDKADAMGTLQHMQREIARTGRIDSSGLHDDEPDDMDDGADQDGVQFNPIKPAHLVDMGEGEPVQPGENPAPHSGKVLYLAVMPGNRKPKAVPSSSVGFYQARARLFYEAPGMTAVQARQAIKDGTLLPTWQNGQPVTSYAVSGSKVKPKVDKKRVLLGDALAAREGTNCLLRLGSNVYSAQWSYRSYSQGGGRHRTWHEQHLSGFTYSPDPVGYKETKAALRAGAEWEVGVLQEDYDGVPMGGIVAAVRSGLTLADVGSEQVKQQVKRVGLGGRPFRVTDIAGPYRLTAADLDSLSRV